MATTYHIKGMRVVRVSGKVAQRHPERVFTVYGKFFANGDKTPLSIVSKNIDIEDIQSVDFSIDLTHGILTLNEGQRGRKASQGITEDDLMAELAAIRGETA